MLKAILTILGLLAVALAAFFKLLHEWTNEEEKRRAVSQIKALWFKLDSSGFRIFTQIPLQLLDILFTFILGGRSFSRRAFFRTGMIGLLLLIILFAEAWIMTGKFMGFSTTPWESYEFQFETFVPKMEATIQEQMGKDNPQADLYGKQALAIVDSLKAMAGPKQYLLLSITFLVILSATTILTFVACTATARLFLREMISIDSILLRISVLISGLLYGIAIGFILCAIIVLAAFPMYLLPIVIPFFRQFPLVSAMLLLVIFGIMAYLILWLQISMFIALLPTMMLASALILSILLFPIRRLLYRLLNNIILRTIEKEQGIFILISVTFTTLGAFSSFVLFLIPYV